jgi:ATP-dependent DNA helicase RecQ
LIYLRSRREGEALAERLKQEGLASQVYHAGLSGDLRRKIEQQWLNDEIPALVCTSAFGMGIDKPDVRFIVHYHPPFLLSEYLQEIGRAGRDGAPAEAVALMSEPSGWLDSQDRDRLRFFERKLMQTHQSTLALLNHLPSHGHINEINQIKEIKEIKGDRQGEIALGLLHRLEQLEWSDPFHFQLKSGASVSAQRLRALQKEQHQQSQAMSRYLNGRSCRWRFLLAYFDVEFPSPDWRCLHCDRCRSRR